jgi:hypothetical protein
MKPRLLSFSLLLTMALLACAGASKSRGGGPPADDDASPLTDCAEVAGGMIDTCKYALAELDGALASEADAVTWCGDSERILRSDSLSPFWSCGGDCVTAAACSTDCFNRCFLGPDPGGTGCEHTTYMIYSCGVEFTFTGTNFWIPEMDMAAYCQFDASVPWSCYAACTVNNPCTRPSRLAQAQVLFQCLNACGGTDDDDDDSSPSVS